MHLEHDKLTEIKNSTLPEFDLNLRMPGWKPDQVRAVDELGIPQTNKEVLYSEEVLMASVIAGKIVRMPFKVSFGDEAGTDWILGSYLHEKNAHGQELDPEDWNEFNKWLYTVSVAARNYNASLYRLRRLHLIVEKNPLDMPPLPTDTTLLTPKQAEEDWKGNVAQMRAILLPKSADNENTSNPFLTAIVDLVQVNGYIVSIRAVAKIFVGGDSLVPFGPQPAGSSSSHWSLSSPFSSYSPFGNNLVASTTPAGTSASKSAVVATKAGGAKGTNKKRKPGGAAKGSRPQSAS